MEKHRLEGVLDTQPPCQLNKKPLPLQLCLDIHQQGERKRIRTFYFPPPSTYSSSFHPTPSSSSFLFLPFYSSPSAPNRQQSFRHYREEFAETMAARVKGELITFPGVAAFGHGDGDEG